MAKVNSGVAGDTQGGHPKRSVQNARKHPFVEQAKKRVLQSPPLTPRSKQMTTWQVLGSETWR